MFETSRSRSKPSDWLQTGKRQQSGAYKTLISQLNQLPISDTEYGPFIEELTVNSAYPIRNLRGRLYNRIWAYCMDHRTNWKISMRTIKKDQIFAIAKVKK
jgi:hypothetical protein